MSDIIDQPTYNALVDAVGEDFIEGLLQADYEEMPELLAALQKAMVHHDYDSFQWAAHSIKSTSNSFGAFQFAELAKELEMMWKAKNLEGAQAKVDHLTQDYPQVRLSLEGLALG
jgi:HPt (histidine-containing phosphotransfer) domain-containing protein